MSKTKGNGKKVVKAAEKIIKEEPVVLNNLGRKTIHITLKGTTPLIMHKFSEKKKREMLEKQQKKAGRGKKIRDPEDEFNGARYKIDNKTDGIPAIAFKMAAIRGCKQLGMIMKDFKGSIYIKGVQVEGEDGLLVPIKCKKTIMREDIVTIGNGSSDLRYRPEYHEWSVDLEIEYMPIMVSPEQIVNTLNMGGFICGVGEWRPGSKNGTGQHGMFEVQVS